MAHALLQRSGRPDRRRTARLSTCITPAERADLVELAAAWGVTVSTAGALILSDQLARYRRRAPQLGPAGLVAAASAAVLLVELERGGTYAPPPLVPESSR